MKNWWEECNEEEITWEQIYSWWQRYFDDYNLPLDNIFQEVTIKTNESGSLYEQLLSWWPKGKIQEHCSKLQEYTDTYSIITAPIHSLESCLKEGTKQTLEYLFNVREDEELICALLISSSLFYRINTYSNYPDKYWPDYYLVEKIYEMSLDVIFNSEKSGFSKWHHSCRSVLPTDYRDHDYKIYSNRALVRYLAEEHARILSTLKPMKITLLDKNDIPMHVLTQSDIAEKIARKMREQEKDVKQEDLPKYENTQSPWQLITKKNLEELVWTKAATKVAEDFGISSNAVKKKCKKLGIKTPGIGFWNKVIAGKIQHPKGKPVL